MSIIFSGQQFWIPILLLISIVLSYWMYFGLEKPRKSMIKYPTFLLFILRLTGIFILLLLLLSPYLKYTSKTKYKPIVTFIFDQSRSINNQENSKDLYFRIKSEAARVLNGYELEFRDLNGTLIKDSFEMVGNETNISKGLENIGLNKPFNQKAIVLVSDGIINQGANPNYFPMAIASPIYTLGVGDTSELFDLKVSDAKSNDFVLLGNDFPVTFNMLAYQCQGKSFSYKVMNKGEVAQQGNVDINDNNFFLSKQVMLTANNSGTQRIKIETSIINGEKNIANNALELYVNVLDNRRKIAVLYQGAHPDVKAVQNALSAQKNYQVTVAENVEEALKADAVVAVQVPNIRNSSNVVNNLVNSKKPVLLIGGEMIDWGAWKLELGDIAVRTSKPNSAKFSINKSFGGFSTELEDADILSQMPPLVVPFATYPKDLRVMAFQEINGIQTDYPLIAVKTGDRRLAVIFGEGVWRWSLREFKFNSDHGSTEHLFDHLIQWLLSGRDKPLFSVSSVKPKYDKNDEVVLKAELYNQVFENISDATIKAQIIGDSFARNITFTNTGSYYLANVGVLTAGDYKVIATTEGKTAQTGFSVGSTSQEERILKADWGLLKTLSKNYDGEFYPIGNYALLLNELKAKVSRTAIVKSQKNLKDLIQIPYLLMLIAFLFGAEWILRKYYGQL